MLATVATLLLASPVWAGDFTLVIRGSGKATGPGPSNGEWSIRREAKGRIVLDHSFKGGGIAGTPDTRNTDRYETWIANAKQPIQLRIHDVIKVRGPLFAVNQIRLDTYNYDCPVGLGPDAWQEGKVASSILQFDLKEGKFLFESPRIYAKARDYFKREFVAGPPAWVKKKPVVNDQSELEFEVIHGLNRPDNWYRMSGAFKPGQEEVVLSGKFAFTVPLGASIKAQKLEAELKLVLRRTP